MIAITRPKAPETFTEPRMQDAIRHLYSNSEKLSSLRSKVDMDVLMSLRNELQGVFRGRCAFCESNFGLETPEIVHFRPVTGCRGLDGEYFAQYYWWLAYEWKNIYLSCSMCMKYKRDLFPLADENLRAKILTEWELLLDEKNLLLDPCVDNPEEFLGHDREGNITAFGERGRVTIEVFGLNRSQLVEQRKSVLNNFEFLLNAVKTNSDKEIISEMEDYVNDLFSEFTKHDFPGAQRDFFKLWLGENKDFWDEVLNKDQEINSDNESSYKQIINNSIFSEIINSDFEDIIELKDNLEIDIIKNIQRFTIKSIHIKNLRSICSLDVGLSPFDTDQNRESWLLFLGDNGIGKSSILQAVAIALAGEKEVKRLGLKPSDFLRKGEKEGSITIHSHENEQPIELQFTQRKFKWNTQNCPTFLMGYGATRLLPKGDLKPMKGGLKKVNISNLFDYSIALKDVNKWLRKISAKDFEDRIAPALADLLDLGDDDKILFSDGQLKVKDGGFYINSIDQISDGYRSIIALGCDIMQTLSSFNGGFHSIQGVVLIDELGNHLHPRWRMKIVSSLRRAFPSVQFIVSTHEPLCLRGLSYGEVIVLHEVVNMDKSMQVEALDSKVLPDHTLLKIDQLLVSDLFGLINTLSEEKEKQYQEYYTLLAMDVKELTQSEKDKLENYKLTLTANELKGTSPQVQALYEIVNENFAKKVMEDGFKTQHELKKETIEEVSEMIQNKKFDWL